MLVKPTSVMIVEDEVVTQRYLKDVMLEQGISVSAAVDNGKDALAYFKEGYCELILMDINIKGAIDGLRLAKRILKEYDVCIIFLTAYSDDDTLDEAAELSPYGFIVKPFNPHDIRVAIKIGYKRFTVDNKESKMKAEKRSNEVIIMKNLTYNLTDKVLLQNGLPLNLSTREFKLIDILARNINNIVNDELIILEVWGGENANLVSLRTLIYKLRKRFPSLPLVTYSKMGYMLKCDISSD